MRMGWMMGMVWMMRMGRMWGMGGMRGMISSVWILERFKLT
jgi:hypothetical protein